MYSCVLLIVCGATIGEYAFVGAGAVINRDVEPYALMVGVPARRVGWMSEGGFQLMGTGVVEDPNGVRYEISEKGCRRL